MNLTNSRSLLPSTSVKLSIFQVITVVNRSPAAARLGAPSSVVTGCQVLCQVKPPVGTSLAGVPMLAPKVNRWSKPLKNSTYHPSALAMASWVKTGSESMKTLCGILDVLVAPEPRPAGQVDEQLGVGAERPHGLARDAVILAVEVDEAPAVAEAERLEGIVDVAGAVGRVLRSRVLLRIVDALAGVLDVEHLVAEGRAGRAGTSASTR